MLRLFGFSVSLCAQCGIEIYVCVYTQVLMIGESGVGKSTLVGRLCEDRFMPEHRQYTLGRAVFLFIECSLVARVV